MKWDAGLPYFYREVYDSDNAVLVCDSHPEAQRRDYEHALHAFHQLLVLKM